MAFNIFKKQEAKRKTPEIKNPEQVQPGAKVSFGGMSASILRSPHVTEKSSVLSERNQYVFKVASDATKHGVKNAIREAFGVVPVKVNMVTIHSKTKRRGKGIGVTQGYKKAIVTIQKGQKIEVLPR